MRHNYDKTNFFLRLAVTICVYIYCSFNGIAQSTSSIMAPTFPCDGKIYFFSDRGTNDPYLSYFDGYLPGGTPKITNMCILTGVNNGNSVNALGANPVDGYLYFLEKAPSGTVRLKRIQSNCNIQNVCTGVIPWSIQACFDHQGIYWIIDNSVTPYKLRGYDISTCNQVRSINLTGLVDADVGNDITYDNRDCQFYIGKYKIDYVTGNQTMLTKKFSGAGIATGADGHIYSVGGNDIEMFDIVTQNTATILNQGSGGTSDAASFPCASVTPDFTIGIATGCTLPRSVAFTDNSTGLVTTWLWDFGDGTSSTLQNPTHIYSTSGPFTVKLTSSATTNCLTTATGDKTVTFSIPTNPSPTIANKTDVSCNGGNNGSATISVSGGTGPYTYTWSPSAGNGATISNLTANTYSLTVTDNFGCSATTSATITQPSALSLSPLGSTLNCVGGTDGSVAVSASGGTVSYTYLWNTGATDPTVPNLGAGTYTVTVTDNNSCTKIATATVASPAPVVLTPSSTAATCGQSNGSASVTATGGTSPYTYLWTSAGATTQTLSSISGGSYTVTVTDDKSCTQTTSVVINNSGAATLSLDSTAVTCNGGNNGTATVTVTGGTSPYNYSWNSNPVQTTSAATTLPAGIYTIVVVDGAGCVSSKPVNITEPTAITLATSPSDVLCFGGNDGSATITASGGSGTYISYVWSSGDSGATASTLTAGTYTVTVTDNATCTGTTSFTISQPNALVPTPSSTAVSCFGGNNGTATVSITGGITPYKYSWSATNETTQTISNLSAGNYTVIVSDSNNCTNSAVAVITQSTIISLSTSNTDPSCFGDNSGAVSVTASGGTGPYTYSWMPFNGTSADMINLPPDTYTVTVTDNNGCTRTTTSTVTEPAAITWTRPLISTPVSCYGGTNGSASVSASGGTPTYTYTWLPSGGTGSSASNLAAGTYTVVITDSKNCSDNDTITITQPADITIMTSGTNVNCNGGNDGAASLTASGGTPSYTYSWSPSGDTGTNISNLTAGTYVVMVTDVNNCTKTSSIIITELSTVNADFTPGPDKGYAPLVVSFSNNSTGTKYYWDFGDGTIDSVYNASHVYNKTGIYTVTLMVTDINGCSATQTATIRVVEKSELCVPNVFTPNGDGKNDEFYLCGQGISIIRGTIYNRWGMLLYEWDQPKGGWDGRTSAGEVVPDGVYYYIIYVKADDDVEYPEQKGFIQLLRTH